MLRAARKFMVSEFWPTNHDEFKAVLAGYGTEHNAYLRQALTYWDMGRPWSSAGISMKAFSSTPTARRTFWAKFSEYMPQARKEFAKPEFLLHMEQLGWKA